MSAALRLDAISAGYGRTQVLHDVDLVVPEGATVVLLGANGAGKTTLLKVAAGILTPRKGTVRLGDEVVTDRSEYSRARSGLCLIPEGRGIFPKLSVRENLAMYARTRQVPEAIEKAVAHFPILGERLGLDASSLSGGQQQMLALSRALITDAKVILADELSLGLAPIVLDEIFESLQRLRAEGKSLLIVEQYASRALAVADFVYILHRGSVAFVGLPEQCADERLFARYVGSVA